jgi:2-succinyl-5-enolpyruvyl-6-hydroxy-3-cyclohexene-1-carboxylate synthase
MKAKVNRNILWSKVFIDQLAELGVRHACISPGSRSTPLTYVLSVNRKIKTYVHIDERSSAFFALGLAKASGRPVLVVTTSGTAVAELYPAIIEAYQQRTPLIICTSDRPPELVGTGSNQTINQHNIFANHIRWFRDLGLPSISDIGLSHLQKIAIRAYQFSLVIDKGPVHLNFPFRKPLEPGSHTDVINKKIIKIKPQRLSPVKPNSPPKTKLRSLINKLSDDIIKFEKGIIVAGPMEFSNETVNHIKKLSGILKYPIFADGLSQLRFGLKKTDKNIISNFESILKSENFMNAIEPEIILHFGRTPTSSILEKFLSETNADRYLINSFGDVFDPARNANAVLPINPEIFCQILSEKIKDKQYAQRNLFWLSNFQKAEAISDQIKSRIIRRAKFPDEASLISHTINLLPSGCNIFIGNSLPVRDLDKFVSTNFKNFVIHFNRGASGIDGVTSTASGIASIRKPAILITGDLSFLSDLSALLTANKYTIKLITVLINNNGGGIFESLPIANKVKNFKEYFVTPHNLELSEIIKSFGIEYQLITSLTKFNKALTNGLRKNHPLVLEVQTDAQKSAETRNKYFNIVKNKLNKDF